MKIFRLFLILSLLIFTTGIKAQQTNSDNSELSSHPDSTIYTIVEVMPGFGGDDDLQLFIQEKSKYKTSIRRTPDSKNVFISVVIEKDGHPTFDKVARGYTKKYDDEAIRIIRKMPKWKPGKLNDSTYVRVVTLIPFWFVE